MIQHKAIVFQCQGEDLTGIAELPAESAATGVLLVTGGPQYRIGSHRQGVYLARDLAAAGFPTFRFDYRGMGDAGGGPADFARCSDDIAAAIEAFTALSGVQRIVVWGLCDAASACMIFGARNPRVSGMVLLNPWVRTATGRAKAFVKHYYLKRLASADFWKKLFSGKLAIGKSTASLAKNLRLAGGGAAEPEADNSSDFRDAMRTGLAGFAGPVLFLYSGEDLTADEFVDYARTAPGWRQVLDSDNVETRGLPDMDHTFSRFEWRARVIDETLQWVRHCDRLHNE